MKRCEKDVAGRTRRKSVAQAGMAALALGIVAGETAFGGTPDSWNSAVNGSWTDGTKWSTLAIPGQNDDAIIGAGGSSYRVTLSESALQRNVGSLTISSADADFSFLCPFSGNSESLILNGAFGMSAGTMHIGSSPANGYPGLVLSQASQISGGTVYINPQGVVRGAGSTSPLLSVDGATASLHLSGGSLEGLGLTSTNGATVIADGGSTGGSMVDVDMQGVNISVSSSSVSLYTGKSAVGPVTGNGSFTFDGTTSRNKLTFMTSSVNIPAIIEPGITIRTGSAGGKVANNRIAGTMSLEGTVSSANSGLDITIEAIGSLFQCSGALHAINGGTLHFSQNANLMAGGTMEVGAGSTFFAPYSVLMSGGMMRGYGSVSGPVKAGTGPHTIAPSATLSGNSTGTLTVTNLTTNANTTLAFNLVSPGISSPNDVINVSGTNGLTLNGGIIQIANVPSDPSSLGYYKIIQYNGNILGSGITSLALPPTANGICYSLDTTHDPGFIDLHRGLLGDADCSGTVDFNDFLLLSQNFGKTGGWEQANFNGDPTVDFNDFLALSQNFGQSVASLGGPANFSNLTPDQLAEWQSFGGVPESVPEPASLAILALGAGLMLKRMRKAV